MPAKLARAHVLDHALAQGSDRERTHGEFQFWMRLTTPQSQNGVAGLSAMFLQLADYADDEANSAASIAIAI
jgi:hypothetical protein